MKLSSFLAIFAIFLALISVIVAHPQFGDGTQTKYKFKIFFI